jgi:hypothetical protein
MPTPRACLVPLVGTIFLLALGACSTDGAVTPTAPADAVWAEPAAPNFSLRGTPAANACWGQATRVFAQMGLMGEHASGFETPRLGLRNLARMLHEQNIIPDDSMQALGAFVAAELGLSIDACMS